jgi:hypothetical protein
MLRLALATAIVAACALPLMNGAADAGTINPNLVRRYVRVSPPVVNPPPCLKCGLTPSDPVTLPPQQPGNTVRR